MLATKSHKLHLGIISWIIPVLLTSFLTWQTFLSECGKNQLRETWTERDTNLREGQREGL